MHITKLSVKNFMGVTAVTIEPDGSLVKIGGKNKAGKSSTLLAMLAALGGQKFIPGQPIKEGAKKAEIIMRIEGDETNPSVIVERTFSAKGSNLTLREDRAGATLIASPQTVLNRFYDHIGFDPYAFARMDAKQQAEAIKTLAGLDFTAQDEERAGIYAERTAVNRESKALGMQLDAVTYYEGVQAAEVSIADLMERLGDAENANSIAEDQRQKVRDLTAKRNESRMLAGTLQQDAELLAARIQQVEDEAARYDVETADASAAAEAMPINDTAPIRESIANAGEVNRKVRSNQQHKELDEKHSELLLQSEGMTEAIDAIDAAKQLAIENAEFPIDGLGFDDNGLTYKGMPFSQASQSETIRVSTAIAVAGKPLLNIAIIREASLLDSDGLRDVVETAEEYGAVVWAETVGDDGACTVVIEDGKVKE